MEYRIPIIPSAVAVAAPADDAELLASMGHELRTPLNAVIGLSDLLARHAYGPLSEKQSEFVNHINKSGRQLLKLIDDMLDATNFCQGGNSPHLHPLPGEIGAPDIGATAGHREATDSGLRLDDLGGCP